MVLLGFDPCLREFFLMERNGNLLLRESPKEFARKFGRFNRAHEVVSGRPRNELMGVLAGSGFGNADCLRDVSLTEIGELASLFGKGVVSADSEDGLLAAWKRVEPGADSVLKRFAGLRIEDLRKPTRFFSRALGLMGWKPARNDEDWWRGSGLWRVRGPMGIYRQNTIDGQESFEPFFVKGGFKMDRTREFAGDCVVFDIRNAGPSHLVSWNISPETKLLEDPGRRSPLNGIWWRDECEGMLPSVCNGLAFLKGRKESSVFAKSMLAAAIGVFGSRRCSLYDVDVARSATRALRNTVRRLGVMVSGKHPGWLRWSFADNDSVGFSLPGKAEGGTVARLSGIVEGTLREIDPSLEIRHERTIAIVKS